MRSRRFWNFVAQQLSIKRKNVSQNVSYPQQSNLILTQMFFEQGHNAGTQSWHFKLGASKKAAKSLQRSQTWQGQDPTNNLSNGQVKRDPQLSTFTDQDTEKHLAASPEVVPSGSVPKLVTFLRIGSTTCYRHIQCLNSWM